MSLWTPDGERPVSAASDTPPPGSPQAADHGGPDGIDLSQADLDQIDLDQLTPEQFEQLSPEQQEQVRAMAHELTEARTRLLETDVSMVLANHAFGIYELAAIHLTAEEPKLSEASLAIDALSALMERLAGRLGPHESELEAALQQMQMLFVQRSTAAQADTPS